MGTELKDAPTLIHQIPQYRRPEDMEWEMGRFKNKTKFLFHTRPEAPTEPNAGFLRYEPGAGFRLHRHDFAQVWYVVDGEFRMGGKPFGPGTVVFHPDPHIEEELTTDTGGTIFFVQYQGPTTGSRPVYEGRMNIKGDIPELTDKDLEH
ncbi:MAG TPA: cupin domain-containing protein [Pseudorhodoferax sp.]|nr:cupin domain-containing protein [Pseudorhodoferax sp.]